MQRTDLVSVLKEAWQLTRQGLQPVLGAFLAAMAVALLVTWLGLTLVASWWDLDLNDSESLMEAMQPLQLLLLAVMAPFEAGLAYLGWRRATGQEARIGMVFNAWSLAAPLVLIALVSSVLANLGLFLLILPGIYVMAVLSQANLYYLFHRGSPIKAMIESAKVVHKHLLLVLPFYVVMSLLLLVSLVPMGLGLVITIPLFFYGKGVLFRELFPELSPAEETQAPSQSGESFEA
ncbi:hypothetical protein [Ferrimonas marina]|uniref:Etoposide-induced protein 2.4 (EI24) n=1 Tax=Ferrimonas marina TaxID=299255 RepID=A0A1M5NCQ7_9GAMM|nr:hypothetical protein [Ferrimonas marina]SHG86969.1 hypothetical protein SAMN02745129_0981 [Ferrimonas marina]